jgi:hypothetical protein
VHIRNHQVQLGEDADRPPALKADRPRELDLARTPLAAETARMMLMCVYVCGVRVCTHVCMCGG